MDAGPSEPRPGVIEALGALGRDQRLAAAGAAAVLASLFLPWYGVRVPFAGNLVETGFGSFSFVEAALVLTVGGALALLLASGQGRDPSLPAREGTLLAAAGVWASLLVVFRMFDRPEIAPPHAEAIGYGPRYGIFLALAGALALAIGGIRHRRQRQG